MESVEGGNIPRKNSFKREKTWIFSQVKVLNLRGEKTQKCAYNL